MINKEDLKQLKLFGLCFECSKTFAFLILGCSVICAGLGFSTLQELLFHIEGFHYPGWMTFLIYLSFIILGLIEKLFNKIPKNNSKNIPYKNYALISLLATLGLYLTNYALNYINYATRIIIKSCKIIPVMILRCIILKKSYSIFDYIAAIVLVLGVYFFTIGDKQGYPHFNPLGIILISIAIIADALTSNLEERLFFSGNEIESHSDVLLYLSIFSCGYSIIAVIITGDVMSAIHHSIEHYYVIPLIFTFSILAYISVECVLMMIRHFGAANAEIIKSLRRVFQVAMSFMLFPKRFTMHHEIGIILVFIALFWIEHLRNTLITHKQNMIQYKNINIKIHH